MNTYAYGAALAAAILIAASFTGLAAADTHQEQPEPPEEEEEDGSGISLDPIVGPLEDLVGLLSDWQGKLVEILKSIFYQPFRDLVQALVRYVYDAVTTTPSVQHSSAVQEVHQQVLYISYLLATVVFMAAGLLYMTGPILGFSFAEVRMMLPRVIIALVFGAFSLPLLELVVELINALNTAFAPTGMEVSIRELFGLGSGLILAVVVKATALLALVVLFILRAVYILFVAAISPLLALMWSIPRVKRYANTFIAGWFAALIFAPLDLLVLRFSLALMRGDGATVLQTAANWLLGIASLVLLLLVPFQVWSASQAAVGQGYRVSRTVKKRVGGIRERVGGKDRREASERRRNRGRRRHPRERRSEWK
ncbi:hypothetical protein GRX03_12295 [Halovenus sp. WSH3]|uniref:Uncharacterized protein n=1 Tax=Halovenus carboxidivorans TaxID=2692199 RepID=A0A6B0TBV6_9EURY|nr:hypothetical protein [Halovenus carboxidivorans]MXR52380.1 hypothetical protein [Halovenus carboxidivorans]